MRRIKNSRLKFILFTLICISFQFSTVASTVTWDGGAGTLVWTTATNWSSDAIPVAGDDVVFNTAGTFTITSVPTLSLNSLTISDGTVTFSGGTTTLTLGGNGGTDFTISSGKTLIILGTGNILNITMAANATSDVSGTFQINSGSTFTTSNASTVMTVATSGTIVNSGTITGATAAKLIFNGASTYTHSQNGGTIPTSAWNGTSTCNVTGIVATQVSGLGQAFVNVTWNCSSQTVAQEIAYTGTWSGTLTVTATNTGSLNVGNSGSTYTLTVGTFSQSGGTFYIRGGSASQPSNLTVSGNFTLSTSGIFDMALAAGSGTNVNLNIAGNFTHTGTNNFRCTENSTSYHLLFNGTGVQTIESTGQNSNTFDMDMTSTTASGYCYIASSKTFKIDGAVTLSVNNNGSIATGELTVDGILDMAGASATLTVAGSANIALNGTLKRTFTVDPTITGSITLGSSAIYQHNCDNGTIPTLTWTAGSTCYVTGVTANQLAGVNQTFHHFIWECASQTFTNLALTGGVMFTTINGNLKFLNTNSCTIRLKASCADYDLTVGGDFEVTSSIIKYSTSSACGGGPFTPTLSVGGNYTIGAGGTLDYTNLDASSMMTIKFNGTGTQVYTVSGTQTNTYMNFESSKASGGVSLASDLNVAASRSITFTQGIITTNAYSVILQSTSTVSRTSGHVNGYFKKFIPASAASTTFQIGDASNYTPVTLTYTGTISVSTGSITASTIGTDHPQIASASLDCNKSVNRYWTLTNNSALTGLTSYAAAFTYITGTGDNDAGSTVGSYIIKRYSAGWNATTLSGTPTSTLATCTSLTTYGDFQIAESGSCSYTYYWVGGTGNWTDYSSHWSTTSGGAANATAVPTAADNVIFDANSFSAGGQIVSVDADAYCKNMTWTGATNSPTLEFPDISPTYQDLFIDGSLTLISTVTIDNNNAAYFRYTSTTTGNTITTAGVGMQTTYFEGNGGQWTLSDDYNSQYSFQDMSIQTGATVITGGNDISFGDLTISSTGVLTQSTGNVTLAGAASISGTITISTGILDVDGTFNATGGNITFSGAGTLNLGGATVTSLGTFTESTGTVSYDRVGSQTILAETYYNLTIAGGGSNTKTAGGTVNVSNNFTVNASTVYAVVATTSTVTGISDINGSITISTGTFDANGAFDATGGSVTFTDDGFLYLGSTVTALPSLTNSYGADATTGSTVIYDAAGAQSVAAVDYYNLIIDGSGTKTAAGSFDIGGSNGEGVLTVDTGCTFALGDNTITHTSLHDYSSTYNSSIAGTVTLNNGVWTPTYGQNSQLATSGSITVTGTGTIYLKGGGGHTLGTLTPGSGTIYYSRNGNQTVQANTFNHLIIDGTSGTKTLGGNITVNGNFTTTANGGGVLSLSTYTLTSKGHFTNNGTFTASTGTVNMNGTAAQTISGTSDPAFYALIIDNSSTGVTCSLNTSVTNTLTFTTGLLIIQGYTLTIGVIGTSNGTISGATTGKYIVAYDNSGTIGYLKRSVFSNTTYSFPVGDATNYTPLSFTLNSNAGLSNAYLTVYTKASKIATMNSALATYLNRCWEYSQSGMTTPNYDVSWTYVNADIVGTEADLLPVKKSGSTWYKPTGSSFTQGTSDGTGSVNVGTNTLTWTGLSTFSFGGGAGNGAVALPVELLSFQGEKTNNSNKLTWSTTSEKNNDFFTLEKTTDGINFEVVGIVTGAINSNQINNYLLHDYRIEKVINYYRLKQTDFDGESKLSDVISIDNTERNDIKEISFITNLLGQEVNENYRGVVIIVYSDGSSKKVIQ